MHAPDNVMELPFPPCACGPMHTPPKQYVQLDLGSREPRGKKKDRQTSSCCFHVCSATAKRVPAATSLSFSVENQRGLWKEKKKQQNISFNSSSVAEVAS